MDAPEPKAQGRLQVAQRTAWPCKMDGCIEPGGGVYYNGKQLGMKKVGGRWCRRHDEQVGRENKARAADAAAAEKMFGEKG